MRARGELPGGTPGSQSTPPRPGPCLLSRTPTQPSPSCPCRRGGTSYCSTGQRHLPCLPVGGLGAEHPDSEEGAKSISAVNNQLKSCDGVVRSSVGKGLRWLPGASGASRKQQSPGLFCSEQFLLAVWVCSFFNYYYYSC